MRITQAQLIDLARAEVARRVEANGLTAAYLIGSIVHDQALLGGAADVDLVLVHHTEPLLAREVVRLSDDIHLDIAHHSRDRYAQPRLLRLDPWLGPAIYDPLPLHDPEHFFEWAQASARGQFLRPDHRRSRAQAFLDRARTIRAGLDPDRAWVSAFARAVLNGANAVASLGGQPAAGRRALLNHRPAVTQAGYPETHHALLRLIGADQCGPHHLSGWVASWARAFDAAADLPVESDLVIERRAYYLKGFQALLETDEPHAILWSLIDTWSRTVDTLRSFSADEEHTPAWLEAQNVLGLSEADARRRFDELEAYLDQVEVDLEDWSSRQGA